MKRINTSSIVASFFIENGSLGLSERSNGPSIVAGSLMIENLTRRPNCVLMLPKRGRGWAGGNYLIFDQILFFARIAEVSLSTGNLDGTSIFHERSHPLKSFLAKKSHCISLARPLQAQCASFAFEFSPAKSVHRIIASPLMKTSMRPCLIQAAPFINRK